MQLRPPQMPQLIALLQTHLLQSFFENSSVRTNGTSFPRVCTSVAPTSRKLNRSYERRNACHWNRILRPELPLLTFWSKSRSSKRYFGPVCRASHVIIIAFPPSVNIYRQSPL